MRLVIDMTVASQAPHGGTARYAREVLAAMTGAPPPGAQLIPLNGWPRWRSNQRLRPLRRVANLGLDVGWFTTGALAAAARHRADAWFGPANLLPPTLPRPMVVTIHDLNFLTLPGTYDRGYTRYATRAFRLSARRATRVVTGSQAAREDIVAKLDVDPGRVAVVHPGADHLGTVEPATDDLDLPKPYALFVGQTEPHKNVGLLLDAWRAGVPDGLHLVICGPAGRDDERLRGLAGAADLRTRVHFTGRLDDAALARAYQDARLFLFPSMGEGFGFPPLEAMARGVPTATSTAGALPEVTAGGAMLFAPDDADALAVLVTRLATDPNLRSRLRAKGRKVAARYTWAATAAALWDEASQAVAV
ncbi:MAG TPA: glycosyltransferase family 1 protein [Candidatus Limnocylindria bacterium]|nr:glycosyltransferase family 1 protein [Candidatus Limnocylindria bacterium]